MFWLWKNILIVLGWGKETFIFDVEPNLRIDDQLQIVDGHNEIRRRIVDGKLVINGTKWPEARNMYMLKHSDHLASAAQYQANKCMFEHQPWRYGQNICITQRNSTNELIEKCLDQWANPNLLNLSLPDDLIFNVEDSKSGHFIQMIWAKTTHIGCGLQNCAKNGKDVTLFICNYFPPGNYIGEQIYNYGPKCKYNNDCVVYEDSKCENNGLCSTTLDRLARDRLPIFIENSLDEL